MKEKIVRFPKDYKCPYCGAELEWWQAFPGGPSKPSKWMCSECLGSFIAVPENYPDTTDQFEDE